MRVVEPPENGLAGFAERAGARAGTGFDAALIPGTGKLIE
jgi:hypothetical protein